MPHCTALRAAVLLIAAGCASGPVRPPPGAVDRVIMNEDGTLIRQTVNESSRFRIAAPEARAWPALLAAYAHVGIAPTVSDRASGLHGNGAFVFPARLGDHEASEFFNCGSGLGGVFGTTGRLTADVRSQLSAAGGDATLVVTHVSGRFRSNEGTSTSAVNCESTGALESLLHAEAVRQLAKGSP